DYFIKNTTNLLLRVKPSIEQGTIENPYGNLGEIENRGLELGLNTVNFDHGFKWETNLNFTTIKNEVLALANNNEDRINDVSNSHFDPPSFITRVGHSIGEFYMHEVVGVFQSWDEIYSSPLQNTPVDSEGNPTLPQTNLSGQTAPGDLKFKNINPDGVINEEDRTIVGKIIPDFTWGMTNSFEYKGIGLNIFIMGVQGVDIYNGARAARERFNQASNQMRSALNSWTVNNTNTDIPRSVLTDPNRNNRASTRWLEDGSYIKIKNIRLFYNLPSSITQKMKISDIQVYANAVNALTFTKYTGFDPEIGNVNNNPEFGNLDAGQYPLSRQFLFGIKVGF
ncbi:MAG: hypothetical protein PHH93_10975, partial [Prolixibacteraceae bacterium]|nr:hypothetical protein [Prolixibacteraceae bacterium]